MKNKVEIILQIESAAYEGKNVARHEGKVYFVEGAVPGDTARCVVKKSKKSYAEVEAIEIIENSSLRVTPKCKYFGICGGCKWQNLSYEAQLEFKRQNVVDSFERIGGMKNVNILPVIGTERQYFYRNKMEFTFSRQRWLLEEERDSSFDEKAGFGLGLHVPKRFEKVLDINECWLQSESSNKILNTVRAFAKVKNLSIYSIKTHEGYMRHLVIRTSETTGEIMVNLVTTYDEHDAMTALTELLKKEVPQISTIVNNITGRKSMVAFGESEKIYHGSGYIYERLGNYRFRISANSFFQTNTRQADRLYAIVKDYACLTGSENVYDLYSGTGTIAIYVSDMAANVIGIESVDSAIQDARKNVELNNIQNCDFILGDLKDRLTKNKDWFNEHPKPDVVIIDPPRSGIHPKVIKEIAILQPKRIVYVSCNPATQARDVKSFIESGYRLEKVQPIDMFPQTYHIETVALLTF
ncbi:MAG: 23S rRNA (uracil(1939)-C(5))-methyltransferase RlmD [Bacteroidetes bacterium]|nr:23S rRNA (uracil(1939)-C(5))-methyltransferase RlmD [Bacteroidota bacterium]MBU1423780.1 23S rRNA (uracil(1939)-C(5))-methyltransferase RlmD [Bacteroidota bacterium]MBU2471381.1 23S rRNA (uracil(1939)-C(5))-methyltransferase RlmD [Bacteroidota bacterium]MBU2636570.1 23S rRNA (uracil(1939)-C(5))-methyltransferase RlmD [Bacteroidota bacterium]